MSPSIDIRTDRTALCGVLLLALAVRLWSVATHTYLAFPDETFQYLEPAHRMAFGSGIITWEFLDGIRSWALPLVLAGIMRLVDCLDSDPASYVLVPRLLCVFASLSIPYAGFRLAVRHAGPMAGLAAGLLCALSPQAVYYAPVIMTEPLATDAALLAIWLGDSGGGRTRLLGAGALFGLACALRYQYAPIIGLVALARHARRGRDLPWIVAGGAAVVLPVLGLLDAIIWGVPFQSVWLNFLRNGPGGVSRAMGEESWSFYLEYFLAAWGPLAPLLAGFLILGAGRLPVLAVLICGTIALHSLPAHKELRFIFLSTAVVPILLGVGLTQARAYLAWLSAAPAAIGATLILAAYLAVSTTWFATRSDDWHRDRAMLRATAAARALPEVCGLAIRTIWVYRSGGYTYWHRDLPLYFEAWDQVTRVLGSNLRLPVDGVLRGSRVPQYPDAELALHADKFNAILGGPGDGLPGFHVHVCHGAGVLDDPTICLFVRSGGCS